METKLDIVDKAKGLISSNPDEAVKLYKRLLSAFPEEFDAWDAFYAMKALRSSRNPDTGWAMELAKRFKDDKVASLYGWLVFDRFVKGKQGSAIIQNEPFIMSLPELCPQKNLRQDSTFPCPTTLSIFKLADAYSEGLFNAKKVNELLKALDYNLLSMDEKKWHTEQRGEIKLASDLEKYFALRTKALIKLKEFKACKELCELALHSLRKFHYNNDLWFKMRIAIADESLGNLEQSEAMFKSLLSSKAGSDKWFLYRNLAEVYYENQEYAKAWKYSVDAAHYGNEPHFLVGLYLLQARILYQLDRPGDGKILAELIAAILRDQGWKDKSEYNRLFSFYGIDREKVQSTREVIERAREFWNSERYGAKERKKGTIVFIHRNGKVGRIRDEDGKVLGFRKKDLVRKVDSLLQLDGAEVSFYEMESQDGYPYAEVIEVLSQPEGDRANADLVGKILDGRIVSIVDFGVFVGLPELPDGLLHKNGLPGRLKETFKAEFKSGDPIRVRIHKVTDKGLQLDFVENE